MQKEKSLSSVLAWQTISKFLLTGLSFFTAPIFTRILSTSDYGQVSVFNTWVMFLGVFVGLQTHQSIPVGRIKYSDNFDNYISNALFISFLSFVVVLPFFIVFRRFLGQLLDFPAFLIPLIVINCFFSYCINIYSCKLLQLKSIGKNTLISLLSALTSVGLSLLLVLNTKADKYIARIYSETIINCVFGGFFFFLVFIKGGIKIRKEYCIFCLTYSLPLIFHYAGGIIFNQSDRVMLKAMNGASATGIYSVLYTFGTVMGTIKQSFASVWEPFYYDYKKNGNTEIKEKAKIYLAVFTALTMGYILVAPEVFKVMVADSYWHGVNMIPLFALSWFFSFLYTFPSLYAFYNKKTKAIALISTIGAVFNIGMNFLLIPKFGAFGAAATTLATHILDFNLHVINVKFFIKGKDYDYNYFFYLRGMIPAVLVTIFFYIFINMWYIRWGAAVFVAIYLIRLVIKNMDTFKNKEKRDV